MGYVRALLHTLVLLNLCVPARVSACVYVRNYVKRRLQTLNRASAIANLPEMSTATDLLQYCLAGDVLGAENMLWAGKE